jgi:hypothetical protein
MQVLFASNSFILKIFEKRDCFTCIPHDRRRRPRHADRSFVAVSPQAACGTPAAAGQKMRARAGGSDKWY